MFRRVTKTALSLAAILLLAFVHAPTAQAEETKFSQDQLDAVYNSPGSVAFGNGPLTIVEFFDYQCSYCKADEEVVNRLLQENPDIRIVYVDFPKLGAMSVTAAKTALAVLQQGPDKYWQFRHILMDKNTLVTDTSLAEAEQGIGIDVDRMQRDMADAFTEQQLQNNLEIAHHVGATLTPTFIVGNYFFPGFHTYDEFQEMIATARAAIANNP